MTSTNRQLNSASRSYLPSLTRTLPRSHEASRSTVEDILYSASRTPKHRVSRNARRRRHRLKVDNVQNQTGIPSFATQLPLDVSSTTDLQTTSISHAPQETLTKDVSILQSTISPESWALHELQESQDEPTTSRVLETSPIIKQSLLFWDSQVLSPNSGDETGHHTSESGHHNTSQLDELDREILAIGSVEQHYQSISTQPVVIQEIPLDDPEYQQELASSHKTLTRNLKHSRNVPECVSEDLTNVEHQIHTSNNPISPAAKRRCPSADASTTRTNAQRRTDKPHEPRIQHRKPKSKGKDINPKAPKKKRRVPDGGLSLGPYKAEPQFIEADEDQEMILEKDPIVVTQPSTPPSRQGHINEAKLLEEPRKQKSKTPGRQNAAQRPFFSQIDPTKFAMPFPCPSPSAQALTKKFPSYRDGFEGSEARPTGNVVPIRKSRPRNPPVDPLSLRMGRLTIVESRSLRDDISPSPKPRNPSPAAIMDMDDDSQLSANRQGNWNTLAVQEATPSKRTCFAENISATSVPSTLPKTGCFQTRQKPKRQVTFKDEVGSADGLHLPLHGLSAPARRVTLSDEEDEFDFASDTEEEASGSIAITDRGSQHQNIEDSGAVR